MYRQCHVLIRMSALRVCKCQDRIPVTFLSTSSVQYLRKAPTPTKTFLGVNKWYWLQLMPGTLIRNLIEAWMRRRWKKNRFSTLEEKERQNIFHRLSVLYAFLTWTGVGLAVAYWMKPKTEEEKEQMRRRRENPLPHEEELNRGGALWWATKLKSPEDQQDTKTVTVFKLRGLSYGGSEDMTLAVKEVGQAIKEGETGDMGELDCTDIYLRRMKGIKFERDGGPTAQQLKADIEAKGGNYDLELDVANQFFGITTRYNADGSVGKIIQSKEDMPTEEDVAGTREFLDNEKLKEVPVKNEELVL